MAWLNSVHTHWVLKKCGISNCWVQLSINNHWIDTGNVYIIFMSLIYQSLRKENWNSHWSGFVYFSLQFFMYFEAMLLGISMLITVIYFFECNPLSLCNNPQLFPVMLSVFYIHFCRLYFEWYLTSIPYSMFAVALSLC